MNRTDNFESPLSDSEPRLFTKRIVWLLDGNKLFTDAVWEYLLGSDGIYTYPDSGNTCRWFEAPEFR